MSTINEELETLLADEEKLVNNKLTRFAYTEKAYTDNDANGVETYNVTNEQNVPTSSPEVMKVNQTVVDKGYRSQASSITRMFMNHFFGRTSFNLNKLTDYFARLITSLKEKLGTANGIATLDEDGRIPYSQLPESAIEVRGSWNAATNTWVGVDESTGSLINGTGTLGDFYLCDVEGWFNASTGESSATEPEVSEGYEQYFVNDRVLYNGSEWVRLKAGEVKTVNGVAPKNGNVTLTKEDIGLGNVTNVATDSELNPDSDNNISNKAVAKAIEQVRKMNAIHDNHLLRTGDIDWRVVLPGEHAERNSFFVLDDETFIASSSNYSTPYPVFISKNIYDWSALESLPNTSTSNRGAFFKLDKIYFAVYFNSVIAAYEFYASFDGLNWSKIDTSIPLEDSYYMFSSKPVAVYFYKGKYYVTMEKQSSHYTTFVIDNLNSVLENINIELFSLQTEDRKCYGTQLVNDMFFAFCSDHVYYEEEGSWIPTNLIPPSSGFTLYNIAIVPVKYLGVNFVINCSLNSLQGMAYSADGKTWTNSNITNIEFSKISSSQLIDTTWKSTLCANASSSSNAKGTYYSEDGKTWTQSSGITSSYCSIPPLYKNGIWVNFTRGSTSSTTRGIHYSVDGKTWTRVVTPASDGFYPIVYHNNVFYGYEWTSTVAYPIYSMDGKTWLRLNRTYVIDISFSNSFNSVKNGEICYTEGNYGLSISDVNVLLEQGIL